MTGLKVGDLFRVKYTKAHYSIKGMGSASAEDMDRLCSLLFVVREIMSGQFTYPIRANIHPMYAPLFDEDKFFDMFSDDEIEVLDYQEPEVP